MKRRRERKRKKKAANVFEYQRLINFLQLCGYNRRLRQAILFVTTHTNNNRYYYYQILYNIVQIANYIYLIN
jgi:hypothetical protein